MDSELNGCPHCGNSLEFGKKGYEAVQIERYIEWWEASCKCGYAFKAYDCTKEQAIKMINTRTAEA